MSSKNLVTQFPWDLVTMRTLSFIFISFFFPSCLSLHEDTEAPALSISVGSPCTNKCPGDIGEAWCGERREGKDGRLYFCQEYTMREEPCMNDCGGNDDYSYCLVNAHWGKGIKLWDYCSHPGTTVNKTECRDECERRGKEYFWCHTEGDDWDYCSPAGKVQLVEYSSKGPQFPCSSPCEKKEESYATCTISIGGSTSWVVFTDDDPNWDYCSEEGRKSSEGKHCIDECEKRDEDYFWCHTTDGSWDYCSVTPSLKTEPYNTNVTLSSMGLLCKDNCGLKGESYFWCYEWNGEWTYCSPDPQTSSKHLKCTDECKRRKEDYYWCNTIDGSWDYCSPKYGPGFGGMQYWGLDQNKIGLERSSIPARASRPPIHPATQNQS